MSSDAQYEPIGGFAAAERRVKAHRSGTDRRMATNQQTPPRGDGGIVLDYVDAKLAIMLGAARMPQALRPLMDPESLVALREDLFERSEMGTKKYGTPLRVHNGRDPLVDLYQELQDAIMYSAQCRLETGFDSGSNLFELLCQIASQVAGELDKRNGNSTR